MNYEIINLTDNEHNLITEMLILKSTRKIIACRIIDSFLTTDTLELPLQDLRSRKFLNLPNKG